MISPCNGTQMENKTVYEIKCAGLIPGKKEFTAKG